MTIVVNIMEKVARELLDKHWERLDIMCHCDQCKVDTLALALNQLPPKYSSNEAGEAFIKAQYLNEDANVSILLAIVDAANKVSQHPRHQHKSS